MPAYEERWAIRGAFANWTMTITLDPPGDDEECDVPAWPAEYLQPVADRFFQAVNYYELSRDLVRDR
jgi:hypothetical protein